MPVPSPPDHDFTPDCDQCVGLCCIAYAFDDPDAFGVKKANGEACPHLSTEFRCNIYTERNKQGFSGCVTFDCLGAGQRVSQDLFPGQNWRDNPTIKTDMLSAFLNLRRVQHLLQQLSLAAVLPLSAAEDAKRRKLAQRLSPSEGWTSERILSFDVAKASHDVDRFLKGLKRHVTNRA